MKLCHGMKKHLLLKIYSKKSQIIIYFDVFLFETTHMNIIKNKVKFIGFIRYKIYFFVKKNLTRALF